MLAMSDVDINQFLPVFAEIGTSVAFLVPTPTGYGKSIMDAIGSVRTLLKDEGIHDYELQQQGPAAKKMCPSFFVTANGLVETEASLYRPITKKGDPRIWFKNLRQYCQPCNLLSLLVYEDKIYVRSGFHCAQPLLEELGYGPVVRVSLACYNTKSEVDRLIAALKKVRKKMGIE